MNINTLINSTSELIDSTETKADFLKSAALYQPIVVLFAENPEGNEEEMELLNLSMEKAVQKYDVKPANYDVSLALIQSVSDICVPKVPKININKSTTLAD